MNLDGIDLMNRGEELTEELNNTIDNYEKAGIKLAELDRDY